MKRNILVAFMLAAVLALSGCTGPSETSTEPETGPSSDQDPGTETGELDIRAFSYA